MTDLNSSFPKTLADLRKADNSILDAQITTDKNLYKTLNLLRKSTLNVSNRLRSILQDAKFVTALHAYLNEPKQPTSSATDGLSFPVVANERCGSWYIPPDLRKDHLPQSAQPNGPLSTDSTTLSSSSSAYFKSTDGHVNQWSFSLRRLNLPLLSILGTHHGAILVDSTRRGKAFPDALRRTVPIWVAVWNTVLFPEERYRWSWGLQAGGLEEGEVSLIEGRLGGFVEGLRGLGLDLKALRGRVRRPVVCLWVANCEEGEWTGRFEDLREDVESVKERRGGECDVLVLCSASRRVVGAEMSENGYIQGAGDDSEGWARGLTAQMFWNNKDEIVNAGHEEVEEVVERLVKEHKMNKGAGEAVLVQPSENLFICTDGEGSLEDGVVMIDCNGAREHSTRKALMLGCRQGKLGSRDLRDRLVLVRDFVAQVLAKDFKRSVVVSCSTGRDLSAGVVLVILCLFYDVDGRLKLRPKINDGSGTIQPPSLPGMIPAIDKQLIKQRLAWITTSKPDVNPSRSTLQAVNSFLMERPP